MRTTLRVLLILAFCATAPAAEPEVRLDRPAPDLRTGAEFERELRQTLLASWEGASLRHILRRITETRKISVLLDRRVDPTQELKIDLTNQTLLDGLRSIAQRVSARVSLVGNVVYIGPPEGAAKLRTLVRLRSNELLERSTATEGRNFELGADRTLHWNDLDRPADLVERIAGEYQLTVDGLEQIPHDLWAGATLPAVNAWEALSLILIQFDRTFVWTDGAAGIRIVPVPDEGWIEKAYEAPGRSANAAVEKWKEQIPGLVSATVRGDRVLVRGTAEQHERIEALLRPGRQNRDGPRASDRPVPVRRRRFTLTIERVPVRAIMRKLAMSGIVFEYDAKRLQAAGVDLDQRVDMNLKQAKPDEFFRAMFDPLDLDFTIDGVTVTLTPRQR